MRTIGQSVTALKTLVVLCLAFRFHHCAVGRRLQQAGPSFPTFTLPSGIQTTLANLPQADSGPLLGEKVFSDSLPVSATNIGLGANSFPAEQGTNLDSLVLSNITLWLQETFPDKCTQSTLCTEIADAIWSGLLSDLTSYGQGSADASWTEYLISAINTTFSVLDPKGEDQIPSPVVAKIESLTPVPTPDPSSVILAGIGSTTSAVDGAIQSLTGFSPADGGFSGVLQRFFGNSKTTSGAAAAVAGSAGG